MKCPLLILCFASIFVTACVSPVPRNVNNVCHIFKQYPKWYHWSKDVEKRWQVPVAVQMAIIHQESKFDGQAMPKRTKLMWIIPWKRPSSAYGYAQVLHSTWGGYKKINGGLWVTRDNFGDAVDFIGWYANQAYRYAHIQRKDAYHLYLAYHEGIGGYQRHTYDKKPWLIQVAHKVQARTQLYQAQLNQCIKS